jgi:hypothetical protein
MKRREFITLLGGAAAWPVAASGQERMRRVAVLTALAESDQAAELRRYGSAHFGLGGGHAVPTTPIGTREEKPLCSTV